MHWYNKFRLDILGIIIITIIIQKTFHNDTDDSDFNADNRSGLKVHTDALTGVQYLSDERGGLTPRIDSTGKIITIRR